MTRSPPLLTSPAGDRPSRVRLFPCPDRCAATDDVAARAVPCRASPKSDLRGGGPVASAPRPPPAPVPFTAACSTSPACRISGGRIHAARPRNARRQALPREIVIEQAVAAPAAPLRHDVASLCGRAGGTCWYGQYGCGYDRNIGQRSSHRHLHPLGSPFSDFLPQREMASPAISDGVIVTFDVHSFFQAIRNAADKIPALWTRTRMTGEIELKHHFALRQFATMSAQGSCAAAPESRRIVAEYGIKRQ